MIGSTIQKYRVVRELGMGAMGAVYEAVDTLTERPVAMKVLRAELARQPELIERFRSEAVTLARLNHPNIALLYEFFLEAGDYYMVMEFVRGRSLEKLIQQETTIEPNLAGSIMRQTLEGLAHAHSMGVLHRDIKPANIIVTDDMRVKVSDFGIARVLGSSRMTRTGRIIGTLEYISPERIEGEEADPRSDLYAAGVVLFEMLTGKLPFAGKTDFELIKAHMEQQPPLLGSVLGSSAAPEWDVVVRKAMAKSPDQRYQTALEFCQGLPGNGAALRSAPYATGSLLPGRPPEWLKAPPASFSSAQTAQGAVVAAQVAKKKNPLMTVLLAATAVMTLLLIFTIVLRIRAANGAKTDVTPEPPAAGMGVPASNPGSSANPINSALPPAGGNSSAVVPVDTTAGKDTKQKAASSATKLSPAEERRLAALRALEGKEPADKNAKRSAALKALDH
jgi:serine/threonine protein kinase